MSKKIISRLPIKETNPKNAPITNLQIKLFNELKEKTGQHIKFDVLYFVGINSGYVSMSLTGIDYDFLQKCIFYNVFIWTEPGKNGSWYCVNDKLKTV